MANFVGGLPTELIKMFEELETNTEQMLADMVSAGADVVKQNVAAKLPSELKPLAENNLKVTRVYKTPSDGAINQQVVISGYFQNKRGKLTPAPLVANLFEYGRSNSPYPKKPFFRASFNKQQIEKAMLKAQEKYIKES